MRTLFFLVVVGCSVSAYAAEWTQLPSLPDAEGFAGMFAGVSNGALIVAGGANFPNKKPWEGGTKVWYDAVYVLESPTAKWRIAGKLPRALGYGVSVTRNNQVICAGGSDHDRHYADVFQLEWSGAKLKTTPLAPLPSPIANSCGAIVNDVLYVAGGIEKPDATETSNRVWQYDFSSKPPGWIEVRNWPGSSRMLAVAAGFEEAFWLIGGVDLTAAKDGTAKRRYLRDAYRYDIGRGWKRLPDLPHPVVAAPSPAPIDGKSMYLLGGDDGSQVDTSPTTHRGFEKIVLRFDVKQDAWIAAGRVAAPRATLPSTYWKGSWIMPSGEVRPGVRSPEIWSWIPRTTH